MANKETIREIIVYAVSLLLKAVLLAASWSGIARKKTLEELSAERISISDKNFVRERLRENRV